MLIHGVLLHTLTLFLFTMNFSQSMICSTIKICAHTSSLTRIALPWEAIWWQLLLNTATGSRTTLTTRLHTVVLLLLTQHTVQVNLQQMKTSILGRTGCIHLRQLSPPGTLLTKIRKKVWLPCAFKTRLVVRIAPLTRLKEKLFKKCKCQDLWSASKPTGDHMDLTTRTVLSKQFNSAILTNKVRFNGLTLLLLVHLITTGKLDAL